jgi:hypothetical protein
VCGDSAFFAGCRNYLDDPALQYVGARTTDLQAHLEATSGKNLSGFLADWFVGEGHPSYTVEWTQETSSTVRLRIFQTTSHPSVPFFEMPVPLRFVRGDRHEDVVFDHTYSGQEFTFQLPFQADSLLFDPDAWLISRDNLVLQVPVDAYGQDGALVYPNPTNGPLTIYLATAMQGSVDLLVSDAAGRMVIERTTTVQDRRIMMDTSTLPAGAYQVEVRNAERVIRLRFVRE